MNVQGHVEIRLENVVHAKIRSYAITLRTGTGDSATLDEEAILYLYSNLCQAKGIQDNWAGEILKLKQELRTAHYSKDELERSVESFKAADRKRDFDEGGGWGPQR